MPRPAPTAFAPLALALALLAGAAPAQEARRYVLLQADGGGLAGAEIERGMREAAEAAGAEVTVHDASEDPLAQAEALAAAVAEGADGIVLRPIDVNGILPAVEEAAAAGTPVVTVELALTDAPVAAHVGVDDYASGAALGQFLAGMATASGEPMTLAVVGSESSASQAARLDGFASVIEGVPLVLRGGFAEGHTLGDLSAAAASDLLRDNPDVEALLATGEAALLGAVAAATEAARPEPVIVYGWGLSLPVVEAIEAGLVGAAVHVDAAEVGRAAFAALDAAAREGVSEPQITLVPEIVTLQNVHEYRPLFQ